MIMTIGGCVQRYQCFGMKPLRFFRKYPYPGETITIPIGQMLFITTPLTEAAPGC